MSACCQPQGTGLGSPQSYGWLKDTLYLLQCLTIPCCVAGVMACRCGWVLCLLGPLVFTSTPALPTEAVKSENLQVGAVSC